MGKETMNKGKSLNESSMTIEFNEIEDKFINHWREIGVLPKRINKTIYFKRIKVIINMWGMGFNYSEIGRKVKLSRSRIQQIVYKYISYCKKHMEKGARNNG